VILGVVKRIFAPVAIAFLLYFAWDARESLLETVRSTAPLRLPAAVLAWSLMHLMSPLLSTVIFRARGHALSYQTAADIHIANLPARYIPGGIWHTVGRIAGFKRLGIGQFDIAAFVFLENVLAIGVAFVIGGSLVAWYQGMEGWGQVAAFAAAAGLTLLLASPFILSYRVVKGEVRFKPGDYLASIGVVVLSWCVGAAAFVIYLTAFPELDLRTSPLETGGVYLFSWGVGFVSVFAPQGIGVFEVVAAELMRGAASLKGTAALLAGFRLVIMVSDGLTWGILQILSGIRQRSNKPGQ
jgi:glycosyltransferase 2 family protein